MAPHWRPLKNDFRIDLAGRVAAVQAGVARGRKECVGGTNQGKFCQVDTDCPGSTCAASGKFAFVWKDQRAGRYDAYTRVVRVR